MPPPLPPRVTTVKSTLKIRSVKGAGEDVPKVPVRRPENKFEEGFRYSPTVVVTRKFGAHESRCTVIASNLA